MKTYNILVVDDIVSNIQTLIEYLEETQKHYEMYSAVNGESALEVIKEMSVDLVITDWEMPEMSGLDLIKTLKKNQNTSYIPCIMITGMRTTSENLREAFKEGAIDFLRKPINQIELIARVESILKLQDAQLALEEQKNRELSMKTLQVFQKNQFLSQIGEKLNTQITKLEPQQRQNFKEILKDINHNTNVDEEWDNFKLHFEPVHPNFFNFLKTQGFKLTLNDLKWCAYIRVGLSTRDISRLLNIDYAGARVRKNRLKKKLRLNTVDDLSDYLSKI